LNLPWEKETDDKLDLKAAEKILNEQHFGLEKVKDRLLEFIAVIKRRKQIKGPILCLVGPPGVGKTSLGKSVAEALGRKLRASRWAACATKPRFAATGGPMSGDARANHSDVAPH